MDDYKKKITIFINSMGGGGAERVVSLLLRPLAEDYNVTLIVMFPVFTYQVPNNVNVISLLKSKPKGLFRNLLSAPSLIYKYLKIIHSLKPNISISFLFKPNLINGLTRIFSKHTKVILSERNYPSIMYASSKIRFFVSRFFIKKIYSRADVIFSNSQWINKDLQENFGVTNVSFRVIYNPIILPEKVKVTIRTQNFKIASVGRLIELKNHESLLRAMSYINDKINSSLTIFGEGGLKGDLINIAQQLNLDNIYFPGFSYDIKKELLDYDLFILSSISEGFPNALLEAMSVGLPVISTNCKSGPLELLNDNENVSINSGDFFIARYGILVNVNDLTGLVNAINYLLTHPLLLEQLSLKSLERSKDFSIEKIYDDFSNILQ